MLLERSINLQVMSLQEFLNFFFTFVEKKRLWKATRQQIKIESEYLVG